MPIESTPAPERETPPDYEPPHVEDLGTFGELTQHRTIPRVTDNSVNFGTR